MPHGVVQRTMATVDDEAAVIGEALAEIEAATGTRPRGWLGPALVETPHTLDLLAAAGLEYCCDWGPADDLPFDLDVAHGRMIAIPYPVETNDIVVFAVERHPAEELYARCAAALETLHAGERRVTEDSRARAASVSHRYAASDRCPRPHPRARRANATARAS